MSDAAQGELSNHEVFATPFQVVPAYENWPTPANYREYPGGKELPDSLKVWRVQNTGKTFGSVVAHGDGFADSPDAEILTLGYNSAKGPRDAGVSRHGNYLQWGFNGSPRQMTEAGKAFFLNCIVYIAKFDGKAPLVHVMASDRTAAPMYARFIPRISDPKFAAQMFAPELLAAFKGEPKAYAEDLAKYLETNLELVYREQSSLRVDAELKSLGLTSNRKLETLEMLIALRDDPAKSALADKLLARYLDPASATPATARAWLEKNRDRIFFTDVGGFKYMAAPVGYLNGPTTRPQ